LLEDAMARTQISANFFLDEFLVSDKADQFGIPNTPEPEHLKNITEFLVPGLEKARTFLENHAIVITSAYRNPRVNKLVGGTPTSAHPKGFAADIRVAGFTHFQTARILAASTLEFDQLILEISRNIVHLSFDPRRRMQVKTQARGPGTEIVDGLPD
jgi:zinc D-Ala-D-Ala carboxypeptidase